MKLLLDTHIWLWALRQPEKLSLQVRRRIDSPKNELYLSPISIWEAYHVVRRKRMRIADDFQKWLDDSLFQLPIQEAPFNFAVAAQAGSITLPQSDIGDIFIAATARVFDLTLVTSDSQLLKCSWLKTLANE